MNDHLEIYNFGPIKEAKIDFRDLTVFIGPQATGKSIAAQLVYFMRGLEDILLPDLGPDVQATEAVLAALEWWLGNPVSVYAETGARLIWVPGDASIEPAIQAIEWKQDGIYLSEALKTRVSHWLEDLHSPEAKPSSQYTQSQIYIPAGRTLYSFIPPYSRFYARSTQEWPGYILTFYETLGTTIQKLSQRSQPSSYQLSMLHILDPASSLPLFIREHIQSILKGRIRYSKTDTILLEVGQKLLNPATIAAGQMELWPLWAIIEAWLDPISYPQLKTPQIYVEEPEAHLHPSAQRMILEIVAYLVGQGNKFVLTTHTPYILYAINNFLMAQKVLESGRSLPETVPQETALRPDQVAAYCFSSEGQVYNILDAEIGLIDTDELDQVADNLGAIFTDLQERLEDSA